MIKYSKEMMDLCLDLNKIKHIESITIESDITIWLLDNSSEGFTQLIKIELTDSYPDPNMGYRAVLDHHSSCKKSLQDAAGFLIYPFASPTHMIPGETAHFNSDLVMTVQFGDGSNEKLWLDFPDDPEKEKADIERSLLLMLKFIFQTTGLLIEAEKQKKVTV